MRLVVSDPLFFLLGYWYGDAAVEWMERRTRTWGQMLRQIEKWFGKAAYPIVFIAPNNYICLFAGAAGMSIRAFVVLNVTGSMFRLWLVRVFGQAFEAPIDVVVDWIGDNRAHPPRRHRRARPRVDRARGPVGRDRGRVAGPPRRGARRGRRGPASPDQGEGTPPDPSERSDAPD